MTRCGLARHCPTLCRWLSCGMSMPFAGPLHSPPCVACVLCCMRHPKKDGFNTYCSANDVMQTSNILFCQDLGYTWLGIWSQQYTLFLQMCVQQSDWSCLCTVYRATCQTL
jgi:hypothetical protein